MLLTIIQAVLMAIGALTVVLALVLGLILLLTPESTN